MVAIGSCDYCGAFCQGLGVESPYLYADASDRVPKRIEDAHYALVSRRLACGIEEGYDWVQGEHVGPWHDRRGRPHRTCRQCRGNGSHLDTGEWDAALDHARCSECTDEAEVVHEDETGRLWRKESDDDEILLVEVVNSTPARNGRRKSYLLRVPPEMETARDAVAWTFRMEGQAYRPTVET